MLKKLESGRSMLEMLGVLAIIGVLSIGGIAGYTMSMRRHRANQLIDLLNKYALDIYTYCQHGLANGDVSDLEKCIINYDDLKYKNSPLDTETGFHSILVNAFTQKSNVDIITLSVDFTDNEICKTVKSIVGIKNNNMCGGGLPIPFKMN